MKKRKKLLKVIVALILVLAIAFGIVWFFFLRAPKKEVIYDRVVELIEGSYAVNTVFYGAGLPVYRKDSAYADFTHLYYGFDYAGTYEIVKEGTQYISSLDIKNAAEAVYSKAYLEDVLYPLAFDGYAIDGGGKADYAFARYLEDEEWIYQSTSSENYLKGMRIYDYSTMRIVYPSTSKACYVEMDSWLEDDPEKVTSIQLRLVLQDGEWYLDSFTG